MFNINSWLLSFKEWHGIRFTLHNAFLYNLLLHLHFIQGTNVLSMERIRNSWVICKVDVAIASLNGDYGRRLESRLGFPQRPDFSGQCSFWSLCVLEEFVQDRMQRFLPVYRLLQTLSVTCLADSFTIVVWLYVSDNHSKFYRKPALMLQNAPPERSLAYKILRLSFAYLKYIVIYC